MPDYYNCVLCIIKQDFMIWEDCSFTVAVIKSILQYFVHHEDPVGSQELYSKKSEKRNGRKGREEQFSESVLASRNPQPQMQSPFLK